MQPVNEGNLLEIIDLAHTLRQEHLFIQHEQESFERLSETFSQNSATVAKLGWICAQHRQNLNHLIVTRTDTGPSVCCNRANRLENTKFLDAYKAKGLKYQHVLAFNELFNYLYRSPYFLAQSLAAGDRISKIKIEQINSVVHTTSTGLYGNGIHSKDVEMILKLLRELIEIQIVTSENPRRMLRAGSSAFARLYHRLLESLFSAKIFLTAALHEPVMSVLIKSENILDIDPNKVLMNLSSKEKLRRFGEENSEEYQINIQKFRNENITNLFVLANHFIENLIHNWSLFPSTLRWLVQTMCHQLKQAHINDKNINEIITDMVFTHFICPAIVSPDIFGISDAPILEQARFNLIQIGQIIQMLALMKYEDVDPKYADVYEKFDTSIVTNLLDQLLISENGVEGNGVVAIRSQQSDFERVHVLITRNELNIFVDYFRIVLENDELCISGDDRRKLGKILDALPDKFENIVNGDSNSINTTNSPQMQIVLQEHSNRAKQSLINLGKSTKNKLAKTISLNITNNTNNHNNNNNNNSSNNGGGGDNNNDHNSGSIGLQNGLTSSSLNNTSIMTNQSNNNSSNNLMSYEENEQVLIFPILITDENKLQLLTEEEVLKMNSIGQEIDEPVLTEENIEKLDKVDSTEFDGIVSVLRPLHNKTTRFSLSHDDASIGNSDNLEAVSEAPSNHSVTSSLELEENDQNDNLSDMVSANVSGRGTPNISGRDTPSSQVTDGDNIPQIPTPQMAKIINKARSDIEDKFCKFEIKKLIEGDETISIISDTWSTDVLASDSETLDANDRDRNFSTPLIPSAVVLPGDNNFDVLSSSRPQGNYLVLDASETRSESAWSTDVLVSDSEKLLAEVDTDDNLSITAKSDTTDAGRSEGEPSRDVDNLTPSQSNQNRTPESPFFAPRNQDGRGCGSVGSVGSSISGNVNFQTPDSPVYATRSVESPFFPNTNTYEDPAREKQRFISPISSLARSSVRTTNQFSGENTFQQNYKSGCSERSSSYLPSVASANRMRRQNSGESSTSNLSLNMDDNFVDNTDGHIVATADNPTIRKENCDERKSRKSTKDLIDFNDFQEDGATCINDHDGNKVPDPDDEEAQLREDEDYRSLYEKFSEEHVIHRRTSSEQRNASFDGRRNGMSVYKPGESTSSLKSRRHQSMNYENHEIIINKSTQPRIKSTPNSNCPKIVDNGIVDDEMQQNLLDEIIMIQKTDNLHLTNNSNSTQITVMCSNGENVELLTEPIATIGIIEPLEQNGHLDSAFKPLSKSTGAIPKSISFDASADKSSRNLNARRVHDPLKLNGTGFFNKIKQGFKNRRQNKSRLSQDEFSQRNVSFGITVDNENGISVAEIRRQTVCGGNSLGGVGGNGDCVGNNSNGYTDMTEDILAKYRRKVSTSSETTTSDSTGNSCSVNRKNSDIEPMMANGVQADKAFVFLHAKKKIRTVLSTTDLHTGDFRHTTYSKASPLLTYLQIQLAQALNLQNFKQISYVSEAIRTLNTLDEQQHHKLIEELQGDILKRQSYLQYLMRYRQNLLSTIKNIDQFEERLRSESENCNRHLIGVCVRMFLEKREPLIEKFQEEFCQLTVVDEKIDLLQEHMDKLINALKLDGIIFGMVDWQLDEARISIERILLQRLYNHVMFPNDDGDISRDEVLHEHIRKLQKIITPSHAALRIPQEYLGEAPWPFAQEQISYISAYKTPREKLQCVIRCISSILNLLCIACDRIPAADDLLPVLIYVVIMANPPYLLSTKQYINCFIGNELDGQDQFHWTQFCSVVQFIKTLDYLD